MVDMAAFTPAGDTVSLAVTGTTGRVALTQKPGAPQPELTVVVFNAGPQTAFVAFGTVAVTAVAATSMPIPAGATVEFQVNTTYQTYIAAITGSSTATLYITSGTGSLKAFGVGGGVGGSGEAVTIADGADVAEGSTTDAAATVGGTGTVSAKLRTLTSAVHAEDVAHVTGDFGFAVWAVATDGTTALSAAGDYSVIGTDTAGNLRMVGNVASGVADAGNPVKIGGPYLTTKPTVTNGQRVDAQFDANGRMLIGLVGAGATPSIAAVFGSPGDSNSTNLLGLSTFSSGAIFNNSTWDRVRSVITGTDSIGTGIAAAGILAQFDDTSTTTVTENQFANARIAPNRALLTKDFASSGDDWSYAAATGGISNTTTAVTIKAAAAAGLKNYVTGLQLSSDALGAATEFAIRDGAGGTVLWRIKIGTAGIVNPVNITFPSPIKGTAATLLEVVTLTASITGAVFVNLSGYIAP